MTFAKQLNILRTYSCKGFPLLASFCNFTHVGSQEFSSLCLLLFVAVAMQLIWISF